MKARAKSRNLTLIEILIALSIVVLLGGVVGMNVRGAMAEQNFRNDVQIVVEQLRLAQELMLIADADIEISFKEGAIFFRSEDKIDPRIDSRIKKEIPLRSFQEVTFEGKTNPQIVFMSSGSVMSSGALVLKGKNESRSIVLRGAPGPIQVGTPNHRIQPSWDPLIEVTRFEIAPPKSNPA